MKLAVEFLGLSRRLAQTKDSLVEVGDQATFRDVLRQVGVCFPALVGPIIVPGSHDLVSSYMLNVNGRRVARDLDERAEGAKRLILMFVEAGG